MSLPYFSRQPFSLYPYHHSGLHVYSTSATALPSQSHFPSFRSLYHPTHALFNCAENKPCAHTAPRSFFGTLGPSLPALDPVHMLLPSFAKVTDYRLHCLEKRSTQVLGTHGTRIDKQLKRLRHVAADSAIFDGYCPVTLLKFPNGIRIGFSKA